LHYHEGMPIPERLNPSFARGGESVSRIDPIEEARKRLIIALDYPNAAAAFDLVDRLESRCMWFKVGLELFVAAGPSLVEQLVERGYSIFLDLKFNDIPNTVAGAVKSGAALGARLMTIHASGGPAMLAAAQTALQGLADAPQLLAVTVLTSMDQSQVAAVGVERSPAAQVELLARMGLSAGINGFVCSPQEVAALRKLAGPEAVLVIPGIRPAGGEVGDQKRVATPADALRQGASYLVVGRPITQAPDPAAAAAEILGEMAAEHPVRE
jgi:orotidine-5'-phosphate decarboxylase